MGLSLHGLDKKMVLWLNLIRPKTPIGVLLLDKWVLFLLASYIKLSGPIIVTYEA